MILLLVFFVLDCFIRLKTSPALINLIHVFTIIQVTCTTHPEQAFVSRISVKITYKFAKNV